MFLTIATKRPPCDRYKWCHPYRNGWKIHGFHWGLVISPRKKRWVTGSLGKITAGGGQFWQLLSSELQRRQAENIAYTFQYVKGIAPLMQRLNSRMCFGVFGGPHLKKLSSELEIGFTRQLNSFFRCLVDRWEVTFFVVHEFNEHRRHRRNIFSSCI